MDRRSSRSGANVKSLRDRERIPLQDSRGKADFLTIRVSSTIFVLDDGRATVHGFRAVPSTLLNEMGFHPDWIECQLAHDERNKVRAAYIAKHAIILSALLAVGRAPLFRIRSRNPPCKCLLLWAGCAAPSEARRWKLCEATAAKRARRSSSQVQNNSAPPQFVQPKPAASQGRRAVLKIVRGHVLIDDHLVLRVDGDLGIVADGDLRMRGHGAAVGIGERQLAFAALFQRGKMRCIFATLLFQRRDLFRQILDPRTAGRALLGIARVEPFQIILQLLVGGLMNFCSDRVVKFRSLLLTALMRVPSTASNSRPKRLRSRHSKVNWRNTARKAARLSLRKSAMVLKSGFKVCNSQMTSMLRWHSASSRRLDRTRLR